MLATKKTTELVYNIIGNRNKKTYCSLEVCETTRKVAFSNNTISSAPQILLKSPSCVSSISTLGIRLYTI